MKKMFLICLVLALSVFASETSIDINFEKSDFEIDANSLIIKDFSGDGTLVFIDGIPMISFNVLLPPNTRITDISFMAGNRTVFDNRELFGRYDTELNEWAAFEYFKLPGHEIVDLKGSGFMMGKSIATVAIYPFSLQDGKTLLSKEFKIRLLHEKVSHVLRPEIQSESAFNMQKSVIENAVINPEGLSDYKDMTQILPFDDFVTGEMSSDLPPAVGDSPVDFLIITTDALKDDYKDFMFENHNGYITRLFTLEQIREHYWGADDQELIRKFVRDAYEFWGIAGIMIGGDWNEVPVRFLYLRLNAGTKETASDIYYASLDGSMNFDGDHVFGEDDYEDDIFPEIFIGRVPSNQSSNIKNYFDKCVAHRFDFPENFAGRWLFLGASLVNSTDVLGPDAKNRIIESTDFDIHPSIDIYKLYSPSRIDETGGDDEFNEENTIRLFEDRRYLVNHIDHGDRYVLWTGLKTGGGGLFIPEIDALRNAPYFSILYSFSCDINSLDHETVAQHWLENPDGGGIAFIGNHAKAYTYQIDMDYEFFNSFVHLWEENLGIINQSHRIAIIAQRYSSAIIGLTGYPMLKPYLVDPPRLDISASTPALGDSIIEVVVVDDYDYPVEGATVIISNDEYDMKKAITDFEGRATVHFHFRDDIDHYASCRKYGYVSDQDTLDPTLGRLPFAVVSRVDFEETTGIEDNIPNAGESGRLLISVCNFGTDLITDGTLFINMNGTSISRDTIDFGAIAAGDSIEITSSVFYVDSNLIGRSNILPIVEYDYGVIDTFSLISVGGDIAIMKIKYDDGENGLADMDDSASFTLSFFNIESTPIHNLSLELENDTGFVITSIVEECDTMYGLDSAVFDFVLVEESLPFGHHAEFNAILTDELGRIWEFELYPNSLFPPDSVWKHSGFDFIQLNWTPVNNVLGYNIYRSTSRETGYSRMNILPIWGARYRDINLPPRTTYYYKISSVDSSYNESDLTAPIAGWTSLRGMDGWPVITSSGNRLFAAPVIGDIDGDRFKEVFVAGWDGAVYGFNHRGQDLIDSTITTDPFFVIDTYDGAPHALGHIWGALLMDDIDLDGHPEIIFPTRVENKIYVIDRFANLMPGWPQEGHVDFLSSPAVGNIDDDPYPEIVTTTITNELYVWNHDGTPYGDSALFDPLNGSVISGYDLGRSSPAIGDLESDGVFEIIVGGGDATGGAIHAILATGGDKEGFPIRLDTLGSGVYCDNSPILANIDNDSSTLEIIINAQSAGLCVIDYHGNFLPGFPYAINASLSPAVADFDDDGKFEIFVVGESEMALVDDDGSAFPGWPISLPRTCFTDPVISDVDGDGNEDLLIAAGPEVYAYNQDGNQLPGYPLLTGHDILAPPTIDDINNDGFWEIIQPSYDAYVHVWETDAPAENSTWYAFCGNYRRTGCIRDSTRRFDHIDTDRETPNNLSLIAVYPNPFNSSCLIDAPENSDVSILDINGKLIERFDRLEQSESSSIRFKPEASLESGIYIIKASIDGRSFYNKVVYIK